MKTTISAKGEIVLPAQLRGHGFMEGQFARDEANLIEYPIDVGGKGNSKLTCKLWLDSQTGLPVKRVVIWTQGEKSITLVTETYSQWELDPKLPEDTFALPK